MKKRLVYLDSLRGIAVILMIQQHLQSWLWNEQWFSYSLTFHEHPYMLSLNFLGNFSAAIFLLSSGSGSVILSENNPGKYEFFKRGIFILLCGYLLNIISPHWFKPGSWYILHTIGFSIIIFPLIKMIKKPVLILLSIAIILISAVIQTVLTTPLFISNVYMNDLNRNGGILRLIFAEGHFPLFPWLSFFIAGIASHRCLETGKNWIIFIWSFLYVFTGFSFLWLYNSGYYFATGGTLFRLFVYQPYLYPPLPPLMCIVEGFILLLLFLITRSGKIKFIFLFNSLSSLGRLSLTWFFVHIVLFNEIFGILGIKKSFIASETLLIIISTILIMIIISVLWVRKDLKFSLEWFMRKVIKL